MRAKTHYAERPEAYSIAETPEGCIVTFNEKIEATDEGFSADAYIWTARTGRRVTEQRLAERYSELLAAVKEKEYLVMAENVRARRNDLLAETDSFMSLDRMGLTVPQSLIFTEWLPFFKQLGDVLVGRMAKYRQELRDITAQEGFPYDVKWPEKP